MLAATEIANRLHGVTSRSRLRVSPAGSIRKILIVDDSPSLASVVRQMLDIEGYRTQVAYDGQLGYRTYLDFRPDLVITDVHMTGQSGPELMDQVRKDHPGIRTIYMSGYPCTIEELGGDREGGHTNSFFLQKPFTRYDLLGAITRFSGGEESA